MGIKFSKMKYLVKIVQNQRGATMVEFALALGVFFMFLGGVTDLGLSLHRKSLLTHVSKEVSRLIAIRLADTGLCDKIVETINTEGRDIAENNVKVSVTRWQVEWHPAANVNTYPSFNLSLTAQGQCFFLCHLFPNGLASQSSIESSVSRQSFDDGLPFNCSNVTL